MNRKVEHALKIYAVSGYEFIFTTAVKSYDGFSTREVFADVAKNQQGRTVRLVRTAERDLQWQRDRYQSGANLCVSPDEWRTLVPICEEHDPQEWPDEFTGEHTDAQDAVDSMIEELVQKADPCINGLHDWDVEVAGEVREALFEALCRRHEISDPLERDQFEMKFYPYIMETSDDVDEDEQSAMALKDNLEDIVRRSGAARGEVATLLGVPDTWEHVVEAVRTLAVASGKVSEPA